MVGLMSAPAPQQAPQSSGVTPEEQALYEQVVARGTMLLYDNKSRGIRSGILEMLRANPDDPGAGIGEAAGLIMSRVDEAMAEGGIQADDDLKMQAAAEIYEQVAEAASVAGVHDFEQDDDGFNKGWLIAVDTARQNAQAAGRTTDQDRMNFDDLVQADQDGRLDQIMGDLGQLPELPEQTPEQQAQGEATMRGREIARANDMNATRNQTPAAQAVNRREQESALRENGDPTALARGQEEVRANERNAYRNMPDGHMDFMREERGRDRSRPFPWGDVYQWLPRGRTPGSA